MRRKVRYLRLFFLIIFVFFFVYGIVRLSMFFMHDDIEDLPEGVVGYWNFDGWHFFARDSSYLHNDGVLRNGVVVDSGFASFDGKNDFIEVSERDEYSVSSRGLGVSFWMRVPSFDFENSFDNRYVNFLGKGDRYYPNPNQEWGFRVHDIDDIERAKTVYFYVFNVTGGLGVGSHTPALEEGVWYHVVGSTDGVNTYIFLNGKLVDTDPYARFHIVPANSDSSLFFGYRDDSGGFYEGDLDEVIIFDRNLSGGDVMNLYTLQKDKVGIRE